MTGPCLSSSQCRRGEEKKEGERRKATCMLKYGLVRPHLCHECYMTGEVETLLASGESFMLSKLSSPDPCFRRRTKEDTEGCSGKSIRSRVHRRRGFERDKALCQASAGKTFLDWLQVILPSQGLMLRAASRCRGGKASCVVVAWRSCMYLHM